MKSVPCGRQHVEGAHEQGHDEGHAVQQHQHDRQQQCGRVVVQSQRGECSVVRRAVGAVLVLVLAAGGLLRLGATADYREAEVHAPRQGDCGQNIEKAPVHTEQAKSKQK